MLDKENMMSLFKACDIRGVADIELTNEVVTSIAKAIGVKLTGKKVVVGGDFRVSTARLKEIMLNELVASGCKVIDVGNLATPMFYYALEVSGAEGGIMVTASHNPPEYNGFKLVLGNMPVSEEDINEIAELVEQNAAVKGQGSLKKLDVAADYIKETAGKAQKGKLKVVIDAGNGAVSDFAPDLYRACGYEVVELFCETDGTFPNRPPNPAYPKNLKKLGDRVKEVGADIGIGFDGDGDRAGFVDENGRAVDNDDILVLLSRNYLEAEPGNIIYDAKCSMVVPEQIAEAGGNPIMARAGHTFCKRKFISEKALFAGEISGHFFFCELGYDDGMFAGLKMCEYIARHGKLSALIDAIPNYILTTEARVKYLPNDKEAVLAKVAENLSAYKTNLIDGVRLEFADGWGMIRSSVTEPIFTLRFEAKTEERLSEIQTLLVNALPEIIKDDVAKEVAKMNGAV